VGAAREGAKDRSGAASDCETAGCCRRLHCVGRRSAVAASRRDCDRGTILKGGRHEEALKSVRQQGRESLKIGDWRDLADGAGLHDAPNPIGRDWR